MKAVLYNNGIEIRRANYPRLDMGPIENLSPGLEWKLIDEEVKPTGYDSRIYNVIKSEDNSNDFHPIHTHLKLHKITYLLSPKSENEINLAIEKAESQANSNVMNSQKRDKFLLLGLGILIRIYEGNIPTAQEEIILTKLKNKAIRVWQNDQVAKDKLQEVIDSTIPDLDSNWNVNDE